MYKHKNNHIIFQVLSHILCGSLKDYQLEKKLGDYERAVAIRRMMYEQVTIKTYFKKTNKLRNN